MSDVSAQSAALRLPDPATAAQMRAHRFAITPPGSKSLTNRALLLAALADGQSILRGALLDADDAKVMLRAVGQLGAAVDITAGDQLHISGCAGEFTPVRQGMATELALGNAGTATRFLAAACALLLQDQAEVIIDGDARMRQRPISELVAALCELGAYVTYEQQTGFPPLRIIGRGPASEHVGLQFGTTASSQFISAVLLCGAAIHSGVSTLFTGPITSESYIDMTLGLLTRLGAHVIDERPERITVSPGSFASFDLTIEPDASGATYALAAAALQPGCIGTIRGLPIDPDRSLQGDAGFVSVLRAAGAQCAGDDTHIAVTGPEQLLPFDLDFALMPDTVMTAAVLAACAVPTAANPLAESILRGVQTLRVKETDRLVAITQELAKVGCRCEVQSEADGSETLRIFPALARVQPAKAITFETYNDHRIAMSCALFSLWYSSISIANPGCASKTYPNFWQHFAAMHAGGGPS